MARRTKEEALATRNRLLDAAELLFQAQGVSQTTLQQIAQQAGATRGRHLLALQGQGRSFQRDDGAGHPPARGTAEGRGRRPRRPAGRDRGGHGACADPHDHRPAGAPRVRRATHKVEYTHDMASVQQRHLDARNACVGDFEKALRLAARRARIRLPVPGSVAAQGLHALISGLIQNWLLDPAAFDLVPTGRRTFRVYLAGLGFARQTGANGAAAHEAETAAA